MKTSLKLFFVLTGLVYGMPHAFAQHNQFKHLGTEQGLPQAIVYKAAEDSLGYTWFATSKGIIQYDGKSVKEYGIKDGLTESTFFLVSRVPGTNTMLFVSNSFKLFVYEKGKFRQITSRNDLCWVTYDGQNRPYILTRYGSIYTLENGELIPYSVIPKEAVHYQIHCVNNRDFIMSNDFGVYYLEANKKRSKVMEYQYSQREQYIARIHKLSNGRIFLTNFSGFYEFNTTDRKINSLFPVNRNMVYCAELDERTNNILVGSNDGLWIFRDGKMDAAHRSHQLNYKYVFDIIETSEGMFVFTTFSDGVFMSMLKSKHIGGKEGLKNPNILFVHHQDTDLYLVSDRTEFSILKNNERLIPFDPGNRILLPNIPNLAISDSKGLVIGFTKDRSYALKIFNRKTTVFRKPEGYRLSVTHIDDSLVYFLEEYNEEKNIRIDLKYFSRLIGLAETNAVSPAISFLMLIDRKKNRYYYGKDQGYIRQDLDLPPDSLKPVDLGSDVEFMLKMTDELLIAGTYSNGLALITDTSTIMLKPEDGLSGIRCMKGMKMKNCLWVLTEKGVSRIIFSGDGKVKNITNFHANNVLGSETLNDFHLYDGKVFVAGKQGVSMFDQHISFTPTQPYVNLVNFNINNSDTTLADEYTLPYDKNNITVTYIYPSLFHAGKILYRYTLVKGKDTLTDRTTPDEKLQLYSLASGNYILSLRAMNSNGEWSVQPRTVKFSIAPVFWKTWWFITLIASLILSVVVVISVYRIRVSQRESRLKNKLTESELKALRLHMNPHFIFNTLNSLQRFVLKGNPLLANDYIARLSQLIRWIMEYSDKEELSLQEEIDFLNLYIELEQFRFEKAFECIIQISPEINTYNLFIPSLTIQPFVENAVKYGLSGRTQGRLVLSFFQQGAYLGVVVEDNGVGREQVKKEQELSGKEKASTGISYTEERLKLLIGDERVKPVKIIDLYEQDHATGTRVELLIPILS